MDQVAAPSEAGREAGSMCSYELGDRGASRPGHRNRSLGRQLEVVRIVRAS